MTVKANLVALLAGDATLMAALPGGLYHSTTINRQDTGAAFDTNEELKACAVLNFETEVPFGPYWTSSRLFFRLTFYLDDGTARARAYALLHMQKVTGGVWEIHHADDVLDQVDAALSATMDVSRYEVVRLR